MTSSCLSQPNQRETTLPTSPSPLPLPLPLPLPFPLTFTHPFSSWQAILNYFTSFLPSSNPDPFTTHSSSTLITNLKENKEKELSWSTLIQLLETLADEAKLNPLFSSTVPPCLIPLLSQLYLLDPLPNRSTPLDCPSSSSTTPEKSHYPILRLLTNVLAHHPPHRWTFLHFLQSPPSSSSSSSFCSERHLLSTFASFHLPASSSASSSSSTTVLMKGMLAVLLNFSVHFPPGQLYLLQQHWLVHLLTWATSIQDLDTLVILVHLISVLLQTEASTSSLDENENEHHSPCVSVEEHERNHEDVHDHDPQKEKETVPLDASLALDFFLASPVHGMDTLASLLKPHPTHLPLVSAIMEVCSLFVSHPGRFRFFRKK
ncbi:hypothetical protein HMI56_001449 [Coelomomyces lativittatus]|nr:hypothetical protein HMI56_001449 [Coelomomyces lativittatus]